MSKFTREFKNGKHIFCKDNSVYMSVLPEDLGEFASCASAALAEQTRAQCKCCIEAHWKGIICGGPYNNPSGQPDYCQNRVADGTDCAHDEACHAQNTENQGE